MVIVSLRVNACFICYVMMSEITVLLDVGPFLTVYKALICINTLDSISWRYLHSLTNRLKQSINVLLRALFSLSRCPTRLLPAPSRTTLHPSWKITITLGSYFEIHFHGLLLEVSKQALNVSIRRLLTHFVIYVLLAGCSARRSWLRSNIHFAIVLTRLLIGYLGRQLFLGSVDLTL